MIEPFFLLAFAVLLAIIAVVGHGLWLIMAGLLRCLDGKSPSQAGFNCPRCGQINPPGGAQCYRCGRTLDPILAEELADLDATQRQVRRMQNTGYLKSSTAEKVLARLTRYRRERIGTRLPKSRETAADVGRSAASAPPAAPDGRSSDRNHRPPTATETPAFAPAIHPDAIHPEVVHREVVPPEAVRPMAASAPAGPAQVPSHPEAPWQDAVAEFLAEREIHWAEMIGVLVGGFIMVGSSIALVVNLWQLLEQTPYLKFLIFVAYTSLVFAAGLYAFHRWKLRSTGGGLLTIGTLLVPLNFLAMASLWRSGLDFGAIAAEVVALMLFAGLVRLAAGVLMPDGRWLGPLAVAGNSAAILGMARFVHADQPAWLLAAAVYVPVVLFAGTMGTYLFRISRKPTLGESDAAALGLMLGTSVFAMCIPVGLYIAEALRCFGDLEAVLNLLAVPMALTAAPILATGLRLTHTTASTGLTGNRPASPALGSGTKPSPGDSAAASYHAGGMVVALLAVILGLAALGLAWPEPQSLVTVGLFNAAGLAFAAVRYRFPAAHAGVMICLACSYLISFHWAIGNLAEVTPPELEATLLHLAVSAQSGTALAGMFVAFVLASVMLANMRDPRHGQAYATGAAVVAVVGLMLVSYHGLADGARDAVRAAALYAVYGTGCCSLAGCRKDRGFAYLGVALWTVVPLWLLWMATNEIRPVAATLLAAEAIVAALLAGGVTRAKAALNVFNQPLRQVGKMLAILSLLVWLGTGLTHPDAIGGALSPVATIILLAVFFFQQAWRSEGGASTWFGSFVVLAGLTHSLVANFPGLVAEPWLIATLSHASCALFAALAIEAVAQRQTDLIRRRLVRVFVEPLANSGLLASMLLVLIVPLVWRTDWLFCLGLFWLGTIWLVYAVRNGSVSLFNAHLVAMSVAVVTGATIWLESRGFNLATDGLQPAYLHVYGISLTVTMLPWALLRLLRHRFDAGAGASEETSRTGYLIRLARNGNRLLAATPSVDIALRRGMIFLQLVLAILWLAPEVARELGLPVGPIENGAFAVGDGGAWLLFALLSGGLLVDLWHRCGKMELLGGLALLGVMPWLLASHGIGDVAVATMLRWTAAMGYLGLAVVLWRRAEIARLVHAPRLVHALGVAWEGAAVENRSSPLMPPDRLARIAMLVLGLLPVVGITVVAAMLRLEYVTPRGPLAESPFHALGYHTSYLVPLLFIAIALVGSALRERSGGYALASCLIASLAGVVSWQMPGPLDWHGLVLNQAVALAVSGGFWTMLKLALPDRVPPLPVGDVEVGPSHLAVLTAVGLMLLLTAASAMGDISGSYRVSVGPLEALCLLLVAAAVAFCLWDSSARFPLAAMYFLGLAAAGIWLGYRELGPREYLWNAAPEVGGVLIIAGILGWRFGRMGRVWRALGIPNDEDRWSTHWFHLCQAVLGVIVASLAFWVAFDVENDGVGIKTALFNLHGRRTGPSTSLILMGMTVAMAWQAQGSGRRIWQTAAFGAGFLLNLTIGLASLDATAGSPMAVAPWLNRCAVLVTGAAMLTLLTRVGFPRVLPRSGDWIGVSRDVTPVFGAITAMALPALLAGEVIRFHPANGAPLAMFSVIAIPVLLLLLAVACVVHAVQAARCRNARPAWDMLPSGVGNEPELSPQAFVYAAEAIVAMGALHLWLCQPQWFRLGLVEQYWMFLVMAAAFLGVGISEWFHRVKLSVLSEPLQNTALALPLIPMAGFWFMSPSESPFGLTGGTPALWLLMAVFYGVQAAMRPTSVLLGVLTLFTGSVGLWVLLDRQSLDFFTHPQLWLIPPALAMLVAERLERPLLGASQRETLRYTALSVVYVASTTEFLQGVGHSIWLPLTLLGLSVAGIFAGVAFRIRCYVYLGITFLGVVIVRMIGYAAFEQGQMWLFWACCILLGIAIFIVSAVFERRREVFIAAARKMRQWER
ncbi:MAG: zinc ribbon domain-containing protein [Patescibacteria group bacterium]|nr:zinc ribbon domain-containing protein [Patescibacteria group bacterium]